MGIRDIPPTWQACALLDAYEREHFAFDAGGRTVAESTLALLATFPPNHWLPAGLVRRMSFATMDALLLDAFAFPRPHPVLRRLVRAGLRARGRAVRFLPPRTEPYYARQLPQIRTYPGGYDVSRPRHLPARLPRSASPQRAGRSVGQPGDLTDVTFLRQRSAHESRPERSVGDIRRSAPRQARSSTRPITWAAWSNWSGGAAA